MNCPDCGCGLTEDTTRVYYKSVRTTDRESMMSDLTFTYVNAGNDTNGNPRRGWVVRNGDQIVNFVNEGYEAAEPLRRAYPDQEIHTYDVTSNVQRIKVADYRSYRKVYG